MAQFSDNPFGGKMGTLEVPTAFRQMAEKGVTQARETYEKLKEAAESTNGALESFYSTATKGANDFNSKLVDVARVNTNAAFDLASKLVGVKTVPEAVELLMAHGSKQLEVLSEQAKELAALSQKVTVDAVEPIRSSASKVFNNK